MNFIIKLPISFHWLEPEVLTQTCPLLCYHCPHHKKKIIDPTHAALLLSLFFSQLTLITHHNLASFSTRKPSLIKPRPLLYALIVNPTSLIIALITFYLKQLDPQRGDTLHGAQTGSILLSVEFLIPSVVLAHCVHWLNE